MFAMCTYATVYDYRFDIGGRPLFSWPYFVVPSVSFGTLAGALAVFLITTALSRLPRLNHPAFNIPGFTRATKDRFFVAIEARDDDFDPDRVEAAHRCRCRSGRCASAGCRDEAARSRPGRCCCCSRAASKLDMYTQHYFKWWDRSTFFANGSSMRQPVAGTVARDAPNGPVRAARHHRRGDAGARARAVRHLLRALPRPLRARRGHDRAARLPAAALAGRRRAAHGQGGALLRTRSPRGRARCTAMPPASRRRTAGRSSPTSARCSRARTPTSASLPQQDRAQLEAAK